MVVYQDFGGVVVLVVGVVIGVVLLLLVEQVKVDEGVECVDLVVEFGVVGCSIVVIGVLCQICVYDVVKCYFEVYQWVGIVGVVGVVFVYDVEYG